jgi:hypothetical protein
VLGIRSTSFFIFSIFALTLNAQNIDYVQQLKNKSAVDDREVRFSTANQLCTAGQNSGLPITLTKTWAVAADYSCPNVYFIGNGGAIQPASGIVATFTVDTSNSVICDMSKGGTCVITGLNNFISPTWFNSTTPIQSSVTSASATSFVLIPRTYSGADTYQAGGINNVQDHRLNAFSPYQWITPSRPITGFPMGNDLALDAEGPADISLQHGGLCTGTSTQRCPTTTTATTISATTQDITVGSTANFACSSLQNPTFPITCNESLSVWIGFGTPTQEACSLNSISSNTVMNVTCRQAHSGTTDVQQASVTALTGQTNIVLESVCPSHAVTHCPVTIGTNQGSVIRLPANDSDTFPANTIRVFKPLTGAVEGGSHGEIPNPAVMVIQNAGLNFPAIFKGSSGNEIARYGDTATWLGENGTSVKLGDYLFPLVACTGTCTINPAKGVSSTSLLNRLVTGTGTTTALTVTGVPLAGHCVFSPENSAAATMQFTSPGIYISGVTLNTVTFTHGSGLSGAIFSVFCGSF